MQTEMKASQTICESATEKLLRIALLTELKDYMIPAQ